MPKLTIELPDDAYHAALSFTPQERGNLAAIMFTTAYNIAGEKQTDGQSEQESEDDLSIPDYDRPTNEDDLAAIGRGLKAEAEGRTISGDVLFARLKEQARNGGK